jgi:hypothetical protein
MDNLFYSQKEKILFWVAGYTWDGNTSLVMEQVQSLTGNAKKFSDKAGCLQEQVRTTFVNNSCRYKYMRVFYVETEVIPEDSFKLGGDWTMDKWIQY